MSQLQKYRYMRLLLLFHQWHFVNFLYLWQFFSHFLCAILKVNRHVCLRSPHMQIDTDPWNWWKFWYANRIKQPSRQYTVFIQKFGKVVGHLKKVETGSFTKTIFFFLKGNSIQRQKQWHLGADAILVMVKACRFLVN